MTPTYAKSTYLFGRGLGAVILIAFVSWHVQQAGLVGDHGILPASDLLELYRQRGLGFSDLPTLAWWLGADGGSLSADDPRWAQDEPTGDGIVIKIDCVTVGGGWNAPSPGEYRMVACEPVFDRRWICEGPFDG